MKNTKKVLLFHINKDKLSQINALCKKMGLQAVTVERRQYNESLGALAGIQGFSSSGKGYTGTDFPMEMMVFSGIPSDELDTLLAAYRREGIPPVPLKAILTPHNLFWTAGKLYEELMKEYLHETENSHLR